MNNLLVMKFGGTSMGSAERMKIAAEICESAYRERPTAVVVSAMSKVTDLLLDSLRHAEAGDEPGIQRNLALLSQKHTECAEGLLEGPALQATMKTVQDLLAEFERIVRGVLMLGERPLKSVDEAIAIGERLSSQILAAYLQTRGVKALAVNAREKCITFISAAQAGRCCQPDRRRAVGRSGCRYFHVCCRAATSISRDSTSCGASSRASCRRC